MDDVVEQARRGRSHLERALPPGTELRGFSTHLSITVPDRGDVRRSTRFIRTYASTLALLLDRADSPGLLVRPRPGRLELCGEFADGERLRVAAAYAIASVRALVEDPSGNRDLELDATTEPSRQRYGAFVGPTAFGADLYRTGRATSLRRRRGGMVTAQEQMEATWERCRSAASARLSAADRRAVDAVIAGSAPLPAVPLPVRPRPEAHRVADRAADRAAGT